MSMSYDSIDLVTRLYCLELLSQFHWDEEDCFPIHLIFAVIFLHGTTNHLQLEPDELSNYEPRFKAIKKMLEDPISETDLCRVFKFNPPKTAEENICGLPHTTSTIPTHWPSHLHMYRSIDFLDIVRFIVIPISSDT